MKANKRVLSVLIAVLMLISLIPAVSASGEAIELSLNKSSVYAGDSLKVTVYVSGSEVYGFQFNLKYDKDVLKFSSDDPGLSDGWVITSNDEGGVITFAGYSSSMKPLTKKTAVCSVIFDISDDFAVGAKSQVSASDVILSVGMPNSALNISGDSAAFTSVKRPSADATLSSLTLKDQNGKKLTYSPAFSSTRMEYSLTVPFEVTKIEVDTDVSDNNAKFTVNSPVLTVGKTSYVTVKTTAENGATRTYTISVTRQEDPDREKGTNASLSSLSVTGYVLSPPFSSDVKEYIVWLPYETSQVAVSAKTADAKASGFTVDGNKELAAGKDNKITVTVTAEDPTVKSLYTITAKRASAQGEQATEPVDTGTEADTQAAPGGSISVTDGNGAEVIVPEGAVPESSNVTIVRLLSDEALSSASKLLGTSPVCLYRVSISDSDISLTNKPLLIQLPAPANIPENFAVVLIPVSESGNEIIPYTSKGGIISFTSAKSGSFAVIPAVAQTTVTDTEPAATTENKPGTTAAPSDSTFSGFIKKFYLPLILVIAAALCLGFIIGLLVFNRKKKKNYDDAPLTEPDIPDDSELIFDNEDLERNIVIHDLPETKAKDKKHTNTVGNFSFDDDKNKQ